MSCSQIWDIFIVIVPRLFAWISVSEKNNKSRVCRIRFGINGKPGCQYGGYCCRERQHIIVCKYFRIGGVQSGGVQTGHGWFPSKGPEIRKAILYQALIIRKRWADNHRRLISKIRIPILMTMANCIRPSTYALSDFVSISTTPFLMSAGSHGSVNDIVGKLLDAVRTAGAVSSTGWWWNTYKKIYFQNSHDSDVSCWAVKIKGCRELEWQNDDRFKCSPLSLWISYLVGGKGGFPSDNNAERFFALSEKKIKQHRSCRWFQATWRPSDITVMHKR